MLGLPLYITSLAQAQSLVVYSLPTITNIDLDLGDTAGGELRTLTGTSFTGASSVTVGVTGSPGTSALKSMCLGNSPPNSNNYPFVGSIAEAYAYTRAITLREVRTLRKYKNSYYGVAT